MISPARRSTVVCLLTADGVTLSRAARIVSAAARVGPSRSASALPDALRNAVFRLAIDKNGTKVQLWDFMAGGKSQWWS